MSIYKQITNENLTTKETEVYNSQSLFYSTSSGFDNQHYRYNRNKVYANLSDAAKNYTDNYSSLLSNFYLSGSTYADSESRYNAPFHKKGSYSDTYPQYFNKFHTASNEDKFGFIISIPQKYSGEYIKPGSFTWGSTTQSTPFQIKDDGYGNIYSTNAHISMSGDTSISSSDNYIGNIFYQAGVIVLSTGLEKFSGSFSYYTMIGATNLVATASFISAKTIYTTEYNIVIEPHEFNKTNNWSAKLGTGPVSGGLLHPDLTGSGWTPYFNTVGFYDEDNLLIAKATYPQNIKTRRDIPITLKIKQDW